ncbi:MAG TPA: MBL fold metallo-hydrolase [Rhodocyclaceae bacterium]|nr:MBL fold metallo-hydrolase [Rhodocyclaceae bacterium]HMZ82917.1 MBL fold metallo-hydrolase [Rhodocyclaceae bacterium]HNC60789.1 MBL fold metallo-hydrolase [Rhodocyclaceae bacterium]HNH97849.1 MBL fold metallo-hydrolase [Rhodocyclaceae bacterium]
MIRFGCLGSGSSGNCLVVEVREQQHTTRVLLDCGFPLRDAVARLARLDIEPESIDAVLVTHEHSDHVGGVFRFAARYRIRVFITHGTLSACSAGASCSELTRVIDSHQAFSIDAVHVEPFPVPHDAREPVQFVFSDGVHKLGVLTDTGHATPHIVRMLSGVDALVLECNHDLDMLQAGSYPPSLKRRIASPYGHLDNAAAADLLGSLDRSRLRHLVAAHLSQQNNSPDRARSALARAAACDETWIGVADQASGFDWRQLR